MMAEEKWESKASKSCMVFVLNHFVKVGRFSNKEIYFNRTPGNKNFTYPMFSVVTVRSQCE